MTIGFSSGHDAKFLNKIAQSGTDLGNFFYVDTAKATYREDVKDSLASSLSMAMVEDGLPLRLESTAAGLNQKAVLAKNPYFPEEEEKKEGDVDMSERVVDENNDA